MIKFHFTSHFIIVLCLMVILVDWLTDWLTDFNNNKFFRKFKMEYTAFYAIYPRASSQFVTPLITKQIHLKYKIHKQRHSSENHNPKLFISNNSKATKCWYYYQYLSRQTISPLTQQLGNTVVEFLWARCSWLSNSLMNDTITANEISYNDEYLHSN